MQVIRPYEMKILIADNHFWPLQLPQYENFENIILMASYSYIVWTLHNLNAPILHIGIFSSGYLLIAVPSISWHIMLHSLSS